MRIDFSLPPGETSETITVTEEVPMLNITSSTLGGTLSNRQINDLPLNGRNYENLLQLRPGVVRYPGGGFSTTSTNGLRAEDNVYIIDGLFDSEPFSGQGIINGAGIAGDSATILPIDAIQEFNLQENPAAEYGWKPGAIVNVGLKSGTNTLHGTGYGFYRDGIFDARNYFNPVDLSENTPRLEAVRRHSRRSSDQRQAVLLWRLRRATLYGRELLWGYQQPGHGFSRGRSGEQHSGRHRRLAGGQCPAEYGQPGNRGLHGDRRGTLRGQLQRQGIPHQPRNQSERSHRHRERFSQQSHFEQRGGENRLPLE